MTVSNRLAMLSCKSPTSNMLRPHPLYYSTKRKHFQYTRFYLILEGMRRADPSYVKARYALASTYELLFRADMDPGLVNEQISQAWGEFMQPAADYIPRVLCWFDAGKVTVEPRPISGISSLVVVDYPRRADDLVVVPGQVRNDRTDVSLPVLDKYNQSNRGLLVFSTQVQFVANGQRSL